MALFLFLIALIATNYILRFNYENRFCGAKSNYLMASQLVKLFVMAFFAYIFFMYLDNRSIQNTIAGYGVSSSEDGVIGLLGMLSIPGSAIIAVLSGKIYLQLFSWDKNNKPKEIVATIKRYSNWNTIVCGVVLALLFLMFLIGADGGVVVGILFSVLIYAAIIYYPEHKFVRALDSAYKTPRVAQSDKLLAEASPATAPVTETQNPVAAQESVTTGQPAEPADPAGGKSPTLIVHEEPKKDNSQKWIVGIVIALVLLCIIIVIASNAHTVNTNDRGSHHSELYEQSSDYGTGQSSYGGYSDNDSYGGDDDYDEGDTYTDDGYSGGGSTYDNHDNYNGYGYDSPAERY